MLITLCFPPIRKNRPVVLIWGSFAKSLTQGTFGNVWTHFYLSQLGVGCYLHLVDEAGDAAKYRIMSGIILIRKNYPAPNVDGTEIENPEVDAVSRIYMLAGKWHSLLPEGKSCWEQLCKKYACRQSLRKEKQELLSED